MTRHIFISALAAMSLAASAQETMYLIKGDQVVAKYNVNDVDYASFTLPDGVQDLTGNTTLKRIAYQSAIGIFHGNNDDAGAEFEIQFSTREINDEQPPLSFLYLRMSTPNVTDISDIRIASGVYTIGDLSAPAPFKFYTGIRQVIDGTDVAGGTLTLDRPDFATNDLKLVTDGQVTIAATDNGYSVSGMLKLENGNVLDFSYNGTIVIDNQSSEQKPADELDLPESKMTADRTITPSEAYGVVWTQFLADHPKFDYAYILIYEGSDYDTYLQLGLLIDREKNPGILLPKGKYPVIKRTSESYQTANTATMPAFAIQTESAPQIEYGCWLCENYSMLSPLTAGEVEVLEDATDLNNVKLKVTLQDNAATPHTVTCNFSGKLEEF